MSTSEESKKKFRVLLLKIARLLLEGAGGSRMYQYWSSIKRLRIPNRQ